VKRIKNMGLVAIAVLAVTASVGAATASASGFVADKYNAVVNAPGSSETFIVEGGGMKIACNTPSLAGELKGPAATLTPFVGAATCLKGAKPLNMSGCGFTFHPGAEVSGIQYGGTFDIGPAGCGSISIEYLKGCILSLSPKTGLSATYINSGTGNAAKVSVNAKAEGLTETLSGAAGCSHGTGEAGKITTSWELKATNAGAQTGLHVSSGTYGIYLAGESSAEKAKQPRLEAEKYPALISAAQSSANLPSWNMGTSTVACQEAQFNTEASAATAELSVAASYGKCATAGIYGVKVRMNGCHFVYHILNLGPPYAGSVDIACTKEGEAIEVRAYGSVTKEAEDKPICVDAIGPQTTSSGVAFENVGSGAGRVVSVNTGLTGLKHTYTRFSAILCPPGTGSSTDDKYSSGMVLHGGSF
jgi:hypothetical protein